MSDINKSFENVIRQDYVEYKEKFRNGKLEFYNKGKRIATYTREGNYSGLFRDWREGKTYSLKEYLLSKRSFSYKEYVEFLRRELGSDFNDNSFSNYKRQVNDTRAVKQTVAHANFNTTKFDRPNEVVEKYIRDIRGFYYLPDFVLNRLEYDVHTSSIVFPLHLWSGERVTYQKLKLNNDGTKAGQKLLAKGSMHGSIWYAKGSPNNDTLVVAEGVETAMSIADGIACIEGIETAQQFDYCARIGTRKIDIPEKYKTIIILIDNDKDDSPALKATQEFITELRNQGRNVIDLNAIVGEKGDFADLNSQERGIQFLLGCISHIRKTNTAQTKKSVEEARMDLAKVFKGIHTCENNVLIKVDMGIGKTTATVPYVIYAALLGLKSAVCFQNHEVLNQQLPHYIEAAKKHGLKVAVQKGRNQKGMCSQLEVINEFTQAGQAPKIYCEKECPDKEKCVASMYLNNLSHVLEADIILTTQANLTIKQESSIRRDIIFLDEIGDCQAFLKTVSFNFTENDLDYDSLKKFKGNIPEEVREAFNEILAVTDIIDHMLKTSKHTLLGSHVIDCFIESKNMELNNELKPIRNTIKHHENAIQELEKEKQDNTKKLLERKKGNFEYLNKKIQKKINEKTKAIKDLEERMNLIKSERNIDIHEIVKNLENLLSNARRKIWINHENIKVFPAFFQFFKKANLLLTLVKKQLSNMNENQFVLYQESNNTILYYFENIHESWGNAKRIILDATPQQGFERILGKDYREVTIQANAPYARFHYKIKKGFSKTHTEKAIASLREAMDKGEKSIYKACKKSRLKTTVMDYFNIINSHNKENQKTGYILPKCLHDEIKSERLKDCTLPKDNMLYFGNVRSKNSLKDVDNLVIMGFTLPNPKYFTLKHELLNNEVIYDNTFSFEEKEMYAANGQKYTTKVITHSNKKITSDIKNYVMSEFSQSIERCRTVNRTAENPVDVHIYSDLFIEGYRFDTVEEVEDFDDFYEQRYNEIVTGGSEGIIIEEGFVACAYHGERIKVKCSYQNKRFEESKHAYKAVQDGYKAYILKYKEWKRRTTRILVPPHMTCEEAQEYIIQALMEKSRTGISEVEIIPTEIVFNVKDAKSNIYNIKDLHKFGYFKFLPMYNMLNNIRTSAGESVYLSGMELFNVPDFIRFDEEFIKEKRNEIKECYYKTKKHIDIYSKMCNYDNQSMVYC